MLLEYETYWETWDPFHNFRKLQEEMREIYYEQSVDKASSHSPWVNVWSGQDGLIVRFELAGVPPDDIEVSVVGQNLTVKASIKSAKPKEGERFIKRERASRDFSRNVKIPYRVDSDQTEARYRNGVLTITLKRPQEDKPRKIAVKSK